MTSIAATATLTHGFTMADVQRAAEIAARKTVYMPLDDEDREQTAWHGAVEHLYDCTCGAGTRACNGEITFYELLFAGMKAIGKAADEAQSTHGIARGYPGFKAPRFSQYWGTDRTTLHVLPSRKERHRTDDGFSEHLCERLTLPYVLGLLTPGQYEAIATLAAYDNAGVEAAEALGADYKTFMNQVSKARQRIKEAWFDHETPPTSAYKPGVTCKVGHSRTEYGVLRTNNKWGCRLCDRRRRRLARARNRGDASELEAEPEALAEPDGPTAA